MSRHWVLGNVLPVVALRLAVQLVEHVGHFTRNVSLMYNTGFQWRVTAELRVTERCCL